MNCIRRHVATFSKAAIALITLAFLVGGTDRTAQAQTEPSSDALNVSVNANFVAPRVVQPVDDGKLTPLQGNTHPMARTQFDRGPVDSSKLLERMMLVLKRSPEQEWALAAFNQRQYDPKSADFHHWLHAEEFGELYGPSDADITAVKNWLQNHGFQIGGVGKGRVWMEFSGTVAQVQEAFHVEMHNYLVEGKQHISNDRDPQIPAALAPVVEGIASLNDFRPQHFSHFGKYVKRDLRTGKYTELEPEISSSQKGNLTSGSLVGKGSTGTGVVQPDLGYIDADTGFVREMLTPYDVATVYNILPLWKQSTPINGKGVKVAIVALSDVVTSDFNTFRKSFALPAGTMTTVHNGPDPGLTDSQGENTEDVEMVSATAPGAQVVLVASKDTQTSDGLILGITYITDNEIAPILTMSYGACELALGTAGNTLYNNTFQQAATAGISSFVAAGDSGSSVCSSQNQKPPFADIFGLQVSGMASTPFVTAVGGTDLAWPFSTKPYTTWWNSTNNATTGASAKGYMPEMVWNATCTNPLLLTVYTNFPDNESLCNAAITQDAGLVVLAAGSGGVSRCTKPTGNTPASCAGGYAKPSWQTGSGVPADGKRDIPDVSMFASYGFQQSTGIPGTALLICQATNSPQTSCNYNDPNFIIYQENGGTSAASPLTAGIMALVLQKTGSAQGLANPVFYQLAAAENYAACNSNTVANGSSCIFYDVTSGTNAQVCITGDPNCVTNTSGDQVGIIGGYPAKAKYDVATGLGTMNVANLVNAWPTTSKAPIITLTPASLIFAATTVGTTTAAKVVTVKNTGTAAATLTSETISGTNAGSFLKSATTCGASLAVNATCTVSVEFKPLAAGALSASLHVADNAAGSPQAVALSGTGTAASTVTLTPASLTFDSTDVGSTSAAQIVTLTNGGSTALTITSVTLGGTNPAAFTDLRTCGASLAAKASCEILVAFRPTAAGTLTATLSVADSATGSPQKVTLTGTGAAKPTVTLTPVKLTFAATKVGATSPSQAVTLKNTGTSTLSIAGIALAGTNASSYLQLNTCGTTLAAGTTCAILVDFKPTATGTLTGSLVVTDNGTGSPHSVALTGTGN